MTYATHTTVSRDNAIFSWTRGIAVLVIIAALLAVLPTSVLTALANMVK